MNPDRVADLFEQNQGTMLGLFNMFSGGALERMSILALGYHAVYLCLYHYAVDVCCCPHLEAVKKEGEAGRRKISTIHALS